MLEHSLVSSIDMNEKLSRAEFVSTLGLGMLTTLAAPSTARAILRSTKKSEQFPRSGVIDPMFMPIEKNLLAMMRDCGIPCGVFALTKNGNLLVNRAYGYKNQEQTAPLPTISKFRTASIEKPITNTILEVMYGRGLRIKATQEEFTPDLKLFRTLYKSGVRPPEGSKIDPHLGDITLNHLAEHKAGLNATPSVQDMMSFLQLVELPTPLDHLRWHLGQPLRFDPGSKYEYSTSGYDALKQMMHWVTGNFFDFAQRNVFLPAKARGFGLTKCRSQDRDRNEVWYNTKITAPSIFAEDHGKELPVTDGGGAYHEGHLAMSASAEAIVRYLDTWYYGSGRPLFDTRTGKLAEGIDNGTSVGFGGCIGTNTMMIQNRYWLWSAAILLNSNEPDVKGTPDLSKLVHDELKKIGWA